MKPIPLLLPFLCSTLFVTAQTTSPRGGQQNSTTQQQEQNQQDEKDKETLEGVNDDENRKRRWECSLPGGEYSVNLGAITSVSKHSYVLDGTLLVTEATVDTTGTALARFYYIEPITKIIKENIGIKNLELLILSINLIGESFGGILLLLIVDQTAT